MNLKSLPYLELIELKRQINSELKYRKRTKGLTPNQRRILEQLAAGTRLHRGHAGRTWASLERRGLAEQSSIMQPGNDYPTLFMVITAAGREMLKEE